MTTTYQESPKIGTPSEWLAARKALLEKEKQWTRMRDELAAERSKLPWVKLEKDYSFEGVNGKEMLADLFDGRSQLIVYHFMFGPEWEEGCIGCSFVADHIEGALVHLRNHDVSLAVVSRAPSPKIEAFKKRMGWRFKWVSSFGSGFNFDYRVSFTKEELAEGSVFYNFTSSEASIDELQGVSVFVRNADGDIFHTYSAYARGAEQLVGAYSYLELTPNGRNENGPSFTLMDWVRHHDRYETNDAGECACAAH